MKHALTVYNLIVTYPLQIKNVLYFMFFFFLYFVVRKIPQYIFATLETRMKI